MDMLTQSCFSKLSYKNDLKTILNKATRASSWQYLQNKMLERGTITTSREAVVVVLCVGSCCVSYWNPELSLLENQTLCEWMLITMNALTKGYSFIVLMLRLKLCVWVIYCI